MSRSDEEIEMLIGRQFALEAMLTQLIWKWASSQPHPPTALSEYLRPVEDGMAQLAASSPDGSIAMSASRSTVRMIAEELERTLHREALNRASGKGPVQ